MGGYKLTGRGKTVATILAVSLVLVVLSSIGALMASPPLQNTPSPSTAYPSDAVDVSPSGSDVQTSAPVSNTSPSMEPSADPTTEPSANTSPEPVSDPTPEATPETSPEATPEPGIAVPTPTPVKNTSAPKDIAPPPSDVLSFLYPSLSDGTLDADTLSLLDDFLRAPEYLPDYLIVAETPQLSDELELAVLGALTTALNQRGVPADQLEHISRPMGTVVDSFEVNLYYIPRVLK